METKFLDVLRLASAAGGRDAEVGRAAFDSFLAAVDRVREVVEISQDEAGLRGGVTYISERLMKTIELEREAVSHLRNAISHLEVFAPRREHEPALPPPDDSPQHDSGE